MLGVKRPEILGPPITFVGQNNLILKTAITQIPIPFGVQAGDLLMMFFASISGAPKTTPVGWTKRTPAYSNGDQLHFINWYTKIAVANEPTPSVQQDGIFDINVGIVAYRGAAGVVNMASGSNKSPYVLPAQTVTETNSIVVSVVIDRSPTTPILPPEITSRLNNLTGSLGMRIGDEVIKRVGATAPRIASGGQMYFGTFMTILIR